MVDIIRNCNIFLADQRLAFAWSKWYVSEFYNLSNLFLSFQLKNIQNQVLHPSSVSTSNGKFKLFIDDVIDPFINESLKDFRKTIEVNENDGHVIEGLKSTIENLKSLQIDDNPPPPAKIPRIAT